MAIVMNQIVTNVLQISLPEYRAFRDRLEWGMRSLREYQHQRVQLRQSSSRDQIQTEGNTPMKTNYKRNFIAAALAAAVFLGWATNPASAQSTGAIPPSLVPPDKIQTP